MSSYVVQIRVVGHTANKVESVAEETELLAEAQDFVEGLIELGHSEVVGGLSIDGATPIDLMPVEEDPEAPPRVVAPPRATRKR